MLPSTSRSRGQGTVKADRKRRKRNEADAPVVTQDEDKFMRLRKCLLPGIPNDVAFEHIATKLPWRTFHNLSSVTHAWQQAIQDRLTYDTRVRCHSAETIVVINRIQSPALVGGTDINAFSVYSPRDKSCYQLPPIPGVEGGFPWECQCATLNGKVYILGGTRERTLKRNETRQLGSKDVYVLDLAGQKEWKQCARMQEGRHQFGCGVIDGKIYVFGGTSLLTAVRGSETYDSSVDAWTAIRPMRRWLFNTMVGKVGDELFVWGGHCYVPRYRRGIRFNSRHVAYGLRAYNPATGKWRILSKDFGKDLGFFRYRCFVRQGELHALYRNKVKAYDVGRNSWRELRSISCPQDIHIVPLSVVAVDDEILAAVKKINFTPPRSQAFGLIRSRGFSGANEPILWEEEMYPLSMEDQFDTFMRPLQL